MKTGYVRVLSFIMTVCMLCITAACGKTADEDAWLAGAALDKEETAEAPKAESMDWLIAAVAAFVAQDEEPVSAEAWTPSDILRESPWAKAPRVSKRLSGVNR